MQSSSLVQVGFIGFTFRPSATYRVLFALTISFGAFYSEVTMNLVMLFNSVLPKLNACQDVAIRHSACRSIPDDNPHCYPGAFECMQSLLSFKKPTDAQAKDLLRFVNRHTNVDTSQVQDLLEYFAEVHDINYSIGEI